MKDEKSVAIRVIGGNDILIENNKTYGYDTAVHLDGVSTAWVKGNSSYTTEALVLLEEIKRQVKNLDDNDLSNAKKQEVISILEELNGSNKDTTAQKIEQITNILSNCATISPMVVASLRGLFAMIFN